MSARRISLIRRCACAQAPGSSAIHSRCACSWSCHSPHKKYHSVGVRVCMCVIVYNRAIVCDTTCSIYIDARPQASTSVASTTEEGAPCCAAYRVGVRAHAMECQQRAPAAGLISSGTARQIACLHTATPTSGKNGPGGRTAELCTGAHHASSGKLLTGSTGASMGTAANGSHAAAAAVTSSKQWQWHEVQQASSIRCRVVHNLYYTSTAAPKRSLL